MRQIRKPRNRRYLNRTLHQKSPHCRHHPPCRAAARFQKEPARFFRGTAGLGNLLESLWPKEEYYLGEWHYHPGGKTQPSYQDRRQMQSISEDLKVGCPEPLLIIISDDANPAVYVFPRLQESVYLAPLRENETNGG